LIPQQQLFTRGLRDYVAPLDVMCRALGLVASDQPPDHPLVAAFLEKEPPREKTAEQREKTLRETIRYLADVLTGTDFAIGAIEVRCVLFWLPPFVVPTTPRPSSLTCVSLL
jgi:hypothetical protein